MNKILREEMEYLITCDDKAITLDVRDDVEMTLDYIDELENKINKAIEYIEARHIKAQVELTDREKHLLDILKGEDNDKSKNDD